MYVSSKHIIQDMGVFVNMEIKEWLNRGYELKKKIDKKRRRIEALEERTVNMSPHIDTVGGYNSKTRPVKVNLSDKKVDEENLLFAMEEEYKDVMSEIQGVIDSVDDDAYKTVLELRHVMFLSWPVIAYKMSYSERQIHRKYSESLKDVSTWQC